MGHEWCLVSGTTARAVVVILACEAIGPNIQLSFDWEAGRVGGGVLMATYPLIFWERDWGFEVCLVDLFEQIPVCDECGVMVYFPIGRPVREASDHSAIVAAGDK